MGGGTIHRFEDLKIWQLARETVKAVYAITENETFRKDYTLKDQTRRAANSIALNIAEGFGRRTDKEFRCFLAQAHGSVAEVQAALYLALDQEYLANEKFSEVFDLLEDLSKMITSFSKYLSSSDSRLSTRDSKT
jgi:four helix bundle protein